MKAVMCPECGFQWATTFAEDVQVWTAPTWWPKAFAWKPRTIGTVRVDRCTACGWERETWEN